MCVVCSKKYLIVCVNCVVSIVIVCVMVLIMCVGECGVFLDELLVFFDVYGCV